MQFLPEHQAFAKLGINGPATFKTVRNNKKEEIRCLKCISF